MCYFKVYTFKNSLVICEGNTKQLNTYMYHDGNFIYGTVPDKTYQRQKDFI